MGHCFRKIAALWLLAAPIFADGSLRFYGTGDSGIDRVEISVDNPETDVDIGVTDFTIEAFIKVNSIDPDAMDTCATGLDGWINGAIFWDRDIWGTPAYGDFGASIAEDGQIAWGVADSSGGDGICGGSVDDGEWHHVAVTWDESTCDIALYVDGVQEATSATGACGDATYGLSYEDDRSGNAPDPLFVLGAEKHDAGSEYPSFDGWMDELRISNTLRYTGSYVVPTEPFTTDGNTLALYHFDDGSGTTLTATTGDVNGSLEVGGSPEGPQWSTDYFDPLGLAGARPDRGYTARACGFDLDDDFIYGEAEDDCNVCDGTTGSGPVTVDYDGDGDNETEYYVDFDTGTDDGSCGGPSDPCATLSYALNTRHNQSAETAFCLTGTQDDDFQIAVDDSGVAGYKVRSASGSEVRDFQYPTDPLMIIGWDTDDDGEYPPYDTDDTAAWDDTSGNMNSLVMDLGYNSSTSYVEIAHFEFNNGTYDSPSDQQMSFMGIGGASSGDAEHIYIHDITMFEHGRGAGPTSGGSGNQVIQHFTGRDYSYVAVENFQCTNCGTPYFWRGAADDTGGSDDGPYRFQNVTLTVDGPNGGEFTFSKPWGEVSGIEMLDNYIDVQAGVEWNPGDDSSCFGFAQCVQDVAVVNNYCNGGASKVNLQVAAGGACATRDLCNSTAGSGRGCYFEGNEFVHPDYSFSVGTAGFWFNSGDGSQGLGDVTILNNIFYTDGSGAGPQNWIWDGAGGAVTGMTVTVVGNTFYGELCQSCFRPAGLFGTASSGDGPSVDNWDIRNNIFDLDTAVTVIDLDYSTTFSAIDNNAYRSGASWRYDGSTASTLANWRAISGVDDSDAVQCSPTYVSGATNFHLDAADTCAINNGQNITATISIDYDGETRPAVNSDIGADEYTAGDPVEGDITVGGVTLRGVVID